MFIPIIVANTANVQSWIIDKLKYLYVASILRFFEKCYSHRQLSVKTANDWNTQQKNWENLENMKNIYQNQNKYLVAISQ